MRKPPEGLRPESQPNPEQAKAERRAIEDAERKVRAEQTIALVEKLQELGEALPFPGMDATILAAKRAEEKADPDILLYANAIDDILQRCQEQGIKIELTGSRNSGNVMVLPKQSNDPADNLRLQDLKLAAVTDPDLRTLIELKLQHLADKAARRK